METHASLLIPTVSISYNQGAATITAMAEKKAKEVNIVDQNAIWRETIHKENRCQKLYTKYHINPYKKTEQLTGKPNSHHDTAEGEEDKDFLHIIHKVRVEPRKKYSEPITESQGKFRK